MSIPWAQGKQRFHEDSMIEAQTARKDDEMSLDSISIVQLQYMNL